MAALLAFLVFKQSSLLLFLSVDALGRCDMYVGIWERLDRLNDKARDFFGGSKNVTAVPTFNPPISSNVYVLVLDVVRLILRNTSCHCILATK